MLIGARTATWCGGGSGVDTHGYVARGLAAMWDVRDFDGGFVEAVSGEHLVCTGTNVYTTITNNYVQGLFNTQVKGYSVDGLYRAISGDCTFEYVFRTNNGGIEYFVFETGNYSKRGLCSYSDDRYYDNGFQIRASSYVGDGAIHKTVLKYDDGYSALLKIVGGVSGNKVWRKWFKDGIEIDSQENNKGSVDVSGISFYKIFSSSGNSNPTRFHSARMYSVSLTPAEMQQNMDNDISSFPYIP